MRLRSKLESCKNAWPETARSCDSAPAQHQSPTPRLKRELQTETETTSKRVKDRQRLEDSTGPFPNSYPERTCPPEGVIALGNWELSP